MTSAPSTLGIVLRPDSPLPLYAQLQAALRRRILDGSCPEGSLLPSENELAAALGVSRITVQRAFAELASLGLVRRQRGRGTEVLRAPDRPVVASVDGLVENNLVMGRDTQVTLLDFAYLPADTAVAKALAIPEGTIVQRAVRVRAEKGEPFSYVTSWVPEAIGRTFDRDALATTPLIVLLERAGVQFASAEQVIDAEIASPATAAALDVPPGSALLRINRISRDQNGTPAEWTEVLYNPGRYQYRMAFGQVMEAPSVLAGDFEGR